MVLKYGPFNGLENAWDAYDFAEFFKLFFGNGIFPNPSNNLQVLAHENMQTKISVGVGFVEGHKIRNTSNFILQHDIADGVLKRIDRVVMRANFLQNKGEIIVKRGTPGSSPVAPSLVRNTDYYELALADVLINNGATVITQANITDQRLNTALCGVVATNINQLDTETLILQYQAAFEQMTIEQQQEFEEWVDSLKGILDENVAATLVIRLTDVEGDISNIDNRVTQHLAQNASTTQKGHVQLSNDTNSTSETIAPTMKALNEVKQYANDGKTAIANAVTAKGVSASPTDTFPTLATKIGQINTGKEFFTGSVGSDVPNSASVRVTGIPFKPSVVIVHGVSLTNLDFRIEIVTYLRPNNAGELKISSTTGFEVSGLLEGEFTIRNTGQAVTLTNITYEAIK